MYATGMEPINLKRVYKTGNTKLVIALKLENLARDL